MDIAPTVRLPVSFFIFPFSSFAFLQAAQCCAPGGDLQSTAIEGAGAQVAYTAGDRQRVSHEGHTKTDAWSPTAQHVSYFILSILGDDPHDYKCFTSRPVHSIVYVPSRAR